MAIYRIEKKDNYVVLDKGFLNDKELSWQAKGLLAYMLSLPNDWRFNMNDLKNRSKNGRDATYTIMKELIDSGYVVRYENRDGGKFGKVDYVVHEIKRPDTEKSDTVPPFTEKPYTDNPYTGNPYPENPELLNNKELSNKELNNKLTTTTATKENPITFYEQNFGMLSPFLSEQLVMMCDENSDDLVMAAMKLALQKNRKNLKTVEGILRIWRENNVKTVEDARAYETEFRNQLRVVNGGGAKNGKGGKVQKFSGGNGRPSKENGGNETVSMYKPGSWEDVDLDALGIE